MRIFTPFVEMPMAGHPVIGSTFVDILRYFKDDPSRLQHVSGSGDVGYLGQGEAQALADQTAGAARTAIQRIIAGGLPEPTPPVAMPEAPSAAPGIPPSA